MILPPQWVQKADYGGTRIIHDHEDLIESSLLILYLLETHHLILLCFFPLLQWECLSYACPSVVLWKYIT